MRILTLTALALSLLTLTACPEPGDTYNIYEGDNVTNPQPWYWDRDQDGFGDQYYVSADNPRGRDDVSQTNGDCDDEDPNINPNADEVCNDAIDNDCDGNIDEDDCPASDDDDSAAETVEMAFDFFVNFSSSGLNRIQTSLPGAESQFVEYDLVVTGEPFATASIPELSVQFLHKTNLLDFDPWDIEPVDAYIEVCWVEDPATGAELMEPSSVSPVNNQMLIPSSTLEVFLDEDGHGLLRLVVACLFAEEEVEESIGFAVLIGTNGLTVVDDQGVEHALYPDPDNGSIFNPVSQVWLQSNTPMGPEPVFSRSAASPGGSAVPGWNEVIRFHVAVPVLYGDFGISYLEFQIDSTDKAGIGWNTCDEMDDVNGVWLYSTSDPSTELDGGISFYSELGIPCESAGASALGGFIVNVSPDQWVLAGTTETFSLNLYTPGDAEADDTVLATVMTYGLGQVTTGLPLEGLTLQF